MIKIYLSGSCSSCRKSKKWLRKHHIEFEEINLSKDFMEKDDLIKILSLTENGFEDIIATRTRKSFWINSGKSTSSKTTINFDEDCLLIGFNEDGIRAFIPPEVRRIELRERLILV